MNEIRKTTFMLEEVIIPEKIKSCQTEETCVLVNEFLETPSLELEEELRDTFLAIHDTLKQYENRISELKDEYTKLKTSIPTTLKCIIDARKK